MATSGMDPALLQVEALLAEKNRTENRNQYANFLSKLLEKMNIPETKKSALKSELEQIKPKTPVVDKDQTDQLTVQKWDGNKKVLSVYKTLQYMCTQHIQNILGKKISKTSKYI